MAGSLQDQLLGHGLIKKQKAKNIQTAKKKAVKQSRANKTELVDEAAELAKKAQEEQRRKSQALNAKRKKEAQEKAVLAQIRQIIALNSIEKAPQKMAEEELQAYNFTDNGKVRTLYTSPQNHELISNGSIAIAKQLNEQQESYTLIPANAANKIKERNENAIVLLNDPSTQDNNQTDKDDPYAGFKVPDDLMW